MHQQHRLRICIPICEKTIESAREKIMRASTQTDMIELRLDCLLPDELERVGELEALLRELSLSVIVTLRPAGQGGHSRTRLCHTQSFLVFMAAIS